MASLARTPRRQAPSAALATILSVGLLAGGVGCGSSGDSATDPRGEVEDVVRQTLTSGDAAVCERAMTPRFLEQNFGDQGDASTLEECQFDSALPGEPFARHVGFTSVQLEGQNAVATISVTGGEA